MIQPLADLRIVELSAFVAAPLGGMTLAQMGADVIRIDPIGGNIDFRRWPLAPSGQSLYWAGLNKGKRSVALALDTPEGRALAQALITAPEEGAGILLSNLPDQGWNGHAALQAVRADLISLRLVGNPDGSSAVDYTINPASGFPLITGNGEEPVNHVLPAWDIAAGLYLATGLLAAERHRRRTGKGQMVRLSLADVMLATLGNLGYLADFEINGVQRRAAGNALFGAFGADFGTADGRRVMVVAISRSQWRNLGKATGLTDTFAALGAKLGVDFNDEGQRFLAHKPLCVLLAPWFATRPLAHVASALDAAGVLWGPYQDLRQLMQLDARCSTDNPLFQRLEQPGIGAYLTPGSPLAFGAAPRSELSPAPRLGQHTDQLLKDIVGCSDRDIRRLHDHKIVAGPEEVEL